MTCPTGLVDRGPIVASGQDKPRAIQPMDRPGTTDIPDSRRPDGTEGEAGTGLLLTPSLTPRARLTAKIALGAEPDVVKEVLDRPRELGDIDARGAVRLGRQRRTEEAPQIVG